MVLPERFRRAVESYVATLDGRALVVLLCGSVAQGTMTDQSDLDIVLVYPAGLPLEPDFAEVVHEGVPVQVFCSNELELQASFDWEAKTPSRQRSSLVAGGTVLQGDQELGKQLIQKARQAVEALVPRPDRGHAASLLNFIRYQIPLQSDRLLAVSEPGFLILWNGMMEKYFQVIHQLNGALLPRLKAMDDEVSSIPDRELGVGFSRALRAESLVDKKNSFYELSDLVRARLEQYLAR